MHHPERLHSVRFTLKNMTVPTKVSAHHFARGFLPHFPAFAIIFVVLFMIVLCTPSEISTDLFYRVAEAGKLCFDLCQKKFL